MREWARAVGIAADEAHKINPEVEILPWEYNVDFSPDHAATKAYVMTQLPESTIPLLTFENGKSFELDGQKGYLRDYAINQVGPAEVTQAQLLEARKRNSARSTPRPIPLPVGSSGRSPTCRFRTSGTRRYKALEEWKIAGTLETWSYGFKPNWVAEMRAWYAWSDAPPLDDLLRQIARREFGAGSEEAGARGLEALQRRPSRSIPTPGPNWGSCNALAAPLFFAKPKPRAMTLDHSWSDSEPLEPAIATQSLLALRAQSG